MEPEDLSAEQRRHWESVYRENPQMYGPAPSTSGTYAAELFSREGRASGGAPPVRRILELGAGHGRDSLHFARTGFEVVATDFSAEGIDQLSATAAELGLADRLTAALQDVRQPLPHPDGSFDAVYAHLLLSMALSTEDIHAAVAEVRRVLRPGGLFVYTVRHTGDAHFGEGIGVGDDIWVHGGFAVHFFSRELVDSLAQGWHLQSVEEVTEGELPRRMWRVTQRAAHHGPSAASRRRAPLD